MYKVYDLIPHLESRNSLDKSKELISRLTTATDKESFMLGVTLFEERLSFTIGFSSQHLDTVKAAVRSIYPHATLNPSKGYSVIKQIKNLLEQAIITEKADSVPLKVIEDLNNDPMDHLLELLTGLGNKTGLVSLELWIRPLGKKLEDKIRETATKLTLPGTSAAIAKQIKERTEEKKYYTNYRIVMSSSSKSTSEAISTAVSKFLDHFGLKKGNSFELGKLQGHIPHIPKLKQVMSKSEITTVYHLPEEITEIERLSSHSNKHLGVPEEVSKTSIMAASTTFGKSNSGSSNSMIAISDKDRETHMYIIGKTGAGKTKLLELMMKSDIERGNGMIFLDPHGDTARNIIRFIPREREKDVIYADFTDTNFITTYNPLDASRNQKYSEIAIEGLVDLFKKYFSVDWNPKLEFLLRQAISALRYEKDANLISLNNLLTDPNYRQELIDNIDDEPTKNFWAIEYPRFAESYKGQAVSPLQNKISQLLSNKLVRNIVSYPRSSFDLEDIISNNKILIVNLAIGELGEFSSSFIGSMLVSRILQIMLAQSDTDPEKRAKTHLYVDEFQNFSTDSFIKIFSEARKYGLSLTIAHQYLAQIPQKIREAILGNVGSLIAFRLGQTDANILVEEFKPHLEAEDFVKLSNREFWARLSASGKTTSPFSGKTIDLIPPTFDSSISIVNTRRSDYSVADREIDGFLKGTIDFSEKKEKSTFTSPVV